MSLPLVLQAMNKKNMSITEELVFLDSTNETTPHDADGTQILVRVVGQSVGAKLWEQNTLATVVHKAVKQVVHFPNGPCCCQRDAYLLHEPSDLISKPDRSPVLHCHSCDLWNLEIEREFDRPVWFQLWNQLNCG